ncbi:flavin reductase family protein [Mycolicibacterium rufum]|uniref:Flavin reductase family protein n=1 Tax=Mycolicibacterium rufum TaxID=318424 RepID=A0A9X3BRC7_9MYCO|nr:flavin reductase family protein [Mycolicibacterium rufum]KGI70937.1 Asp/Glu/hydantoin racemase [Mycolicibacterium rufum]MCV7071276.1 flavin reductase family protein [Mycolicibacterium rufum]ULP34672.1 flavin reductase family protein [Mycolicibacterium rufum]
MALPDAHFYRTADGTGLPHDPFNAVVGPRPIGWISTLSADGVRNLAPYSFFNGFNYQPPVIGFASIGWKDSVANVEATGEFVWNLATRPLAHAMNETAAMVDTDVDEYDLGSLTPVDSVAVAPPRVRESPVNFECRLSQLIRLRDAAGADIDTWLVLGEVVAVHIDRDCLVDGVYDTAGPQPILRGGGPATYFEIGPRFEMSRPG